MDPAFWRSRWEQGQIGFHQGEYHPLLVRHAERLSEAGRVLVPLAGKTRDMHFLLEQGHRVVGVELVEDAVRAFFEEAGWTPEVSQAVGHPVYRAQGVELHVCDFFSLTPGHIGAIDAVYDRAALIALPPDLRARYAAHLASLAPPASGVLMITIDYDPTQMNGPPFSVPPSEVEAIFGGPFEIFPLETSEEAADAANLARRGVGALREHALWLRRRG